MKSKLRYRHGDVGLVVSTIPAGAVPTLKKTLAYGEKTGHHHSVAEADIDGAMIFDCGEQMFLRVTAEGGISLTHQEHGTIQVAPGDYEVRIAREYDEEQDFHQVMD
jgi:hypothetical protein